MADNKEKQEVVNENKEAQMAPWKAVVLGATGQTGRYVVKQLAGSPQCAKVRAIVRKQLSQEQINKIFALTEEENKKFEQAEVNYEKLEDNKGAFQDATRAFCCLGTTRAKAGSDEMFRRVDFDYVVNSAKLLKEAGVTHFSLQTSQGANKDSWFLYPRVKGEVEAACRGIGFERYSIFRPGLLLAEREESRTLEWVAQKVWPNWLLPDSAKGVETAQVARAMVQNAFRPPLSQNEEYSNADIIQLKVGKQ